MYMLYSDVNTPFSINLLISSVFILSKILCSFLWHASKNTKNHEYNQLIFNGGLTVADYKFGVLGARVNRD